MLNFQAWDCREHYNGKAEVNELFTSVVWSLSQHAVGEKQSKARQVASLAYLTTILVCLFLSPFNFHHLIYKIKKQTYNDITRQILTYEKLKPVNILLFFSSKIKLVASYQNSIFCYSVDLFMN